MDILVVFEVVLHVVCLVVVVAVFVQFSAASECASSIQCVWEILKQNCVFSYLVIRDNTHIQGTGDGINYASNSKKHDVA